MTDDCKAVVEITSDQGETQLGGLIFGHDAVGSLFGGADDNVGCSLGGAEYDQEFVLDEEVSEMVSKQEAEGVTTHVSSLLRSVDVREQVIWAFWSFRT